MVPTTLLPSTILRRLFARMLGTTMAAPWASCASECALSGPALRIDQVGREDTYLLYFDGTSGWEILPNGTIADLVGDELKFAKHYLWGLNLNVWLADRNQQSRITSPAPNVLVVTDKNDPSLKEELALDTKTFLPTKSGSLSHWQAFAGVKFPQRISNFHNGKRVAVITVERTKINQGLKPADLAVRPPDLKPVMPAALR